MELDDNIRPLVEALNGLPRISTFSSCGGHAERTNPSQKPLGSFFVAFDVVIHSGGWKSLQHITWCVSQPEQFGKINLYVWLPGEEPESMAFEIDGRDADPVALADVLKPFADK